MSPRTALPLRLEYVILGLVRRQPAHGYELINIWNASHGIGLIWRVKPASFYAALEKLEQLGCLTSSLVPGECSPTRKEYRITALGEQSFLNWIKTPVAAARDFRQDFLVKLFFKQDLDSHELQALISQQDFICRGWLASLENQYLTSSGFEAQVLSFRIRQVRSILEWLRDLPIEQTRVSTGD